MAPAGDHHRAEGRYFSKRTYLVNNNGLPQGFRITKKAIGEI